MSGIRILKPGDQPVMEAFLLPRIQSSMFLIGNSRTAGLDDRGETYQGTYAGVYEGNEIVAVTAHYWNQILVLQAPVHMKNLVRAVLSASGRPLKGLIGPSDQVGMARGFLGLKEPDIRFDDMQYLYSLELESLKVPDMLASGKVRGRRIEAGDIDLVTEWEVRYRLEALGEKESPQLRMECREDMERSIQEKRAWILESNGRPVSRTAFNTLFTEAIQVGGVWTPPELRNRGYARAVVAHSLLDARRKGASTAILFTPEDNHPAQKAYEALGFMKIGNYHLLFLKSPMEFFPSSAENFNQ